LKNGGAFLPFLPFFKKPGKIEIINDFEFMFLLNFKKKKWFFLMF